MQLVGVDAEGSRHLVDDRACRATSYSTVPHEYGEHFRQGNYASSHPPAARRRYFHSKCTLIRARLNPQVSHLLEKGKADGSVPRSANFT